MTAEIAILNSSCVALAADSAVTTRTRNNNQKIYNTANKLFNLNKYHPVGILVYSNAEIMGMPWETVIKHYRSTREKNLENSIREEVNHFINFLENDFVLFNQETRDQYLLSNVYILLNHFSDMLDIEVSKKIKSAMEIDEPGIVEILKGLLIKHNKENENNNYWPQYNDEDKTSLIVNYKDKINNITSKYFEKLKINEEVQSLLITALVDWLLKTEPINTGIVISGFGINEFFPSMIALEVDGIINNKLKYKTVKSIENVRGSSINPFAQIEIVKGFIDGIHPLLFETIFNGIISVFKKFDDAFAVLPEVNGLQNKDELISKIKDLNQKNLDSLYSEIKDFINLKMIQPVVNSVMGLPKEELATMAEALVYLTYLRKRISLEDETVGGVVDVAVISKGDGFIWIKRKHYFEPTLNPHFFKNYFK